MPWVSPCPLHTPSTLPYSPVPPPPPGMISCSPAGGHLPSAPRPLIFSCSSPTCSLSVPHDPRPHPPHPETVPSPGPGPRSTVHPARGPSPPHSPSWMASPGPTLTMCSRSLRAAVASTLSACGRRRGGGLAAVGGHLLGSQHPRPRPPMPTPPTLSMRRCPRPASCRSSAPAAPR